MSAKPLGLVFFPAFDWAISPTHPERQERLLYTRDQIVEEGLLDLSAIREYKPKLATLRDLQRVHIGVPGIEPLITDAHLISAGGAIAAAESVLRGETAHAFALVRPPGHHAMRVVHGTRGFCTINIEAVMIEHLRQHYGIRRVAVVDTDVHHGDGTQDIFYHDPDTLFISFHQDGRTLYPGSGAVEEIGGPKAWGTTVNIPLPPGTTDEGLHQVLDAVILPMLADFQPDMIINSAGQDNHYSDPLANMAITAQGYARLAEKLQADVAVLEGGYSIEEALPYVNVGIILAMAGLPYHRVVEPDRHLQNLVQTDRINRYIDQLIKQWQGLWKNRDHMRQQVMQQAGDYWRRSKSIYYDDSGIRESQQETLRICPDCHGTLQIASQAEGHDIGIKRVFGVVLPRDCCPRCAHAGRDAALAAKKQNHYGIVVIQDRQNDTYENLIGR
ncbi:histone deacetylase [Anaerosporomusa subterranea]|uniref:Histone deacetylase n=1 Tax=Anaerosporomusa subterranea TaxID=1794912 RepID=A0A154BRW2_ANASB|nr:histone deacetylase [Anaerosporomusa subterranea]KYZ76649.1 histone deacetylase [Anaerosporomusa subterranea]